MGSEALGFLVDRIYEAGLVPELWPGVLAELAKLADGFGTLLTARCEEDYRWVGSPSMGPVMQEYVAGGWYKRSPRAARVFAARHAGFLTDLDIFTREELDREPVYTEFLRPRGFGWAAATGIEAPSGDALLVDIERRLDLGPVDRATLSRLDELRPHLARAALFSARLRLERARAATEALGLVSLPAGVLGLRGQPLAINQSFEDLMPHIARERQGRLAFADAAADALFAEAFARLIPPLVVDTIQSIPIRAGGKQPPMVVHVIPVRGVAHDVFAGASGVLIVTPLRPQVAPNAEVLQGLFDLTPAEARVARGIGEGRTVDAIAGAFGLSRETVRSQLKTVLSKTGLGRQADLVAMLASVHIWGSADLGP